MQLNYVKIKNFRSIAELTIKFQPKCRVLVGINESGKTNILKALSLLDADVPISDDDLREITPTEDPYTKAYVWFVFTLDDSEKKVCLKKLEELVFGDIDTPIIQLGARKMSIRDFVNSRTEALFTVDLRDKTRTFSRWALSESARVLEPWKFTVESSTTPATAGVPSKTVNTKKLINISSHPTIPVTQTELSAEDFSAFIFNVLNDILKKDLPSVMYWEYSEAQLLPGQIETDTFIEDTDSCLPLKHMFSLAGYPDASEEITKARERNNGLRNLLKRVSDHVTRHMHSVWKDYRNVGIELIQNGGHIDAHIVDHYNTYDLSRRSDGFKRFVSFLLHISVKAKAKELKNTLYLHDEPDIGLHPSGARYLRDELIKVSQVNYVIYATHSPFMVDGDRLDRHLLVSKKAEVTEIKQADESNFTDEEVIFNALGYSIFEHLKKVNIVFEGWRDKRLFQTALTSSKINKAAAKYLKDIGVCFAKGVKDVGRITAMLELATRHCVILSDNDDPAREQQKLYKGFGNWYRYDELLPGCKAVTGEDFIEAKAYEPILAKFSKKFPALGPIPLQKLNTSTPKLQVVKEWLKTANFDNDQTKEGLNEIKHELFEALKPSQITVEYHEFLKQLSAKVGQLFPLEGKV